MTSWWEWICNALTPSPPWQWLLDALPDAPAAPAAEEPSPPIALPWHKPVGFASRDTQACVLQQARRSIADLHAAPDAVAFDRLDAELRAEWRTGVTPPTPFRCYPCGARVARTHGHYIFSCPACGDKFWAHRHATRRLHGTVALVTGGRTKMGHQIVLKLLRAGATVVATSRRPDEARALFGAYPDSHRWLRRLEVLPLDLLSADLAGALAPVVAALGAHGKVDVIVNCAAQTIRARERASAPVGATNRYGDAAALPDTDANSWTMTVADVEQGEMEELFRVNAVAPVQVVRACLPLLRASAEPYVLNVHAREGLFAVHKTPKHIHTNMSKAAMAMFTCTLAAPDKALGMAKRLRVHGCDPGWISLDEYHAQQCPFVVPPLDERDGAARVLHPLWHRLAARHRTRRHYDQMIV